MESKDITRTLSPGIDHQRIANLSMFLAMAAGAMVISIVLFYISMQPSTHDLVLIIELMGATTIFSVLAAYLALRLGWVFHSPNLRLTLSSGYILAAILVFINVWVTAKIMFTSQHDLYLATVLLIFATCMAVAVGYLLSEGLLVRIRQVQVAASEVSAGKLDTRLPVVGSDEMAQLASSFNDMVVELQEADRKNREVDVLRRDLIAWVGHDLRTPLTSIRAIVEALADDMVDDEVQRLHYLNTARSDIRALSSLIDDLFEMAQIDASGIKLEVESVSIADLVSDTLEQFSGRARQAGVSLVGTADSNANPVIIDVRRIERVLANLVSNSIQHTPRGGEVTIEACRLPNELLITVRDTGDGIPPDDLPHVFERFYRGEKSRNRQTGGAGLGLAIARGIVELHQGTIGATSQLGHGTEVWFRIPQVN